MKNPACLIIMDGFGIDKPSENNAISIAKTSVLDKVFAENVMTKLQASGEAVGLPAGQMGNSEVGHLNIGAGRIVYQELTRINKACREDKLKYNEVLVDACKRCRKGGSVLHLMGLISDGGVHSSNEHLYALMDLAIAMQTREVYIHCYMDGRDVPPTSGKSYIEALEKEIAKRNNAQCMTHIQIASVQGRYYVMDRDNR